MIKLAKCLKKLKDNLFEKQICNSYKKRVICLVERSWGGVRKLTISLAKEGIYSVCIIKGKLEREILGMITKYNEISLIPVSRSIFKLYIFAMFLRNFILQNTNCIIMDNRKNYSWVSAINRVSGIKTILLIEEGLNYKLFCDKKPQKIKFILDLAKK